jgi:hypothetical protein
MSTILKDLLSSITQLPETGCWRFNGKLDAYGYGRMYQNSQEVKAHRFYFEACEGSDVPVNMFLRHHLPPDKCIGHACCNPDHLQVSDSPRRAPLTKESTVYKVCPMGHPMTPDNTITERRKGKPKQRCRICRQASWRKNSAKRRSKPEVGLA